MHRIAIVIVAAWLAAAGVPAGAAADPMKLDRIDVEDVYQFDELARVVRPSRTAIALPAGSGASLIWFQGLDEAPE